MRSFLTHKTKFLFLLGCVLLFASSLFYVFMIHPEFIKQSRHSTLNTRAARPSFPWLTPAATTPWPTCSTRGRNFQTGVAFPRWTPTGYSENDTAWLQGLQDIRIQTAACWLEMPVLFSQDSLHSTTVTTGASTPALTSFVFGIHAARALGYHVFVTPLLTVKGPQAWAGAISFSTYQQEQQWFENYWQALKPYVMAAQQAGVEQLALGTEYEWLQKFAPDALWNSLVTHLRSVFSGTLTYDMNWTTLQNPLRAWMHNADLKMIGISVYISLIDTPVRVDPKLMVSLWKSRISRALDAFAIQLAKPVFISEIGYRNSADALYHSWEATSSAPPDPQEQAAACAAALVNIIPDQHILGSFFWGWDDTGAFNLKGMQAATVIHTHYASLQV